MEHHEKKRVLELVMEPTQGILDTAVDVTNAKKPVRKPKESGDRNPANINLNGGRSVPAVSLTVTGWCNASV